MKNTILLILALILASLACSGYWETATKTPIPSKKPTQTATLCPPTANPITLTVWAEKLEIRTGPGTEFSTVGYLKQGDCVDIIGKLLPPTPKCAAGWVQIKQGYVCSEFLK